MRPVIFISAVSKELKTARDHVAKTLLSLGYEAKWQDIAPTEAGDLPSVLRKWVDHSEAVIQLIGRCYGFGPPQPDPQFGLCSYTQYEALYAKSQGKKVWYLPVGPGFICDAHAEESEEFQQLQSDYLQRIREQNDLRHAFANSTELENIVLKMRDDLAPLRAEWEAHRREVEQDLKATRASTDQLLDTQAEQNAALTEMRQMMESLVRGGTEAKLIQDYETALAYVAGRHHLTLEQLRALLTERATQAVGDPHVELREKVRALREAGQFTQARDFAVEAAARLERARQKATRDQIDMLLEASNSEISLGHYTQALTHVTKAESLADREIDFSIWAKARHEQGHVLLNLRRDEEALALFKELESLSTEALGADHLGTLNVRTGRAHALKNLGRYAESEVEYRAIGHILDGMLEAEHPAILMSRNNLALVLGAQDNHSVAEKEHRAVLAIYEREFGAEHPSTLMSRNNLATSLNSQGKHLEAESEHRVVLAIRERVLGPGHPLTLMSRNNLANALYSHDQYSEAEAEYRAVLVMQERGLGAEHPNTLSTRNNLATVLGARDKHSEAEAEYRSVLTIEMRVLGAEHPDTLSCRNNLANALHSQQKYAEAEVEHRTVLAIREHVMGGEAIKTLKSL